MWVGRQSERGSELSPVIICLSTPQQNRVWIKPLPLLLSVLNDITLCSLSAHRIYISGRPGSFDPSLEFGHNQRPRHGFWHSISKSRFTRKQLFLQLSPAMLVVKEPICRSHTLDFVTLLLSLLVLMTRYYSLSHTVSPSHTSSLSTYSLSPILSPTFYALRILSVFLICSPFLIFLSLRRSLPRSPFSILFFSLSRRLFFNRHLKNFFLFSHKTPAHRSSISITGLLSLFPFLFFFYSSLSQSASPFPSSSFFI